MLHPSRSAPRRRSAFAAAFLSALFPGLGQAYVGRYGRALAWAALPVLFIALVAGLLANEGTRTAFAIQFADPTWLLGAVLAIAIDGIYRAGAAVDAYQIARRETPGTGTPTLRALSSAGLGAVILVLLVSHVALARPLIGVRETLLGLGGGDTSSIEPLPSGFETLPPLPPGTPPASSDPSVPLPTPGETAAPTPTQGPPWNGSERLNILLIGADRREEGGGYLTDTMIVATVDPVTKHVATISLPRDMAGIPLPPSWPAAGRFGGSYPSKINELYTTARANPGLFPGDDRSRGYEALKGALSELYQLDIRYYVAVDLAGFREVIDHLGGIVIDVQVPVSDDHYPTDDGRGALNLYIPPGIRYMNGAEALAYARARHKSSDFDRAQRQQRVLTSLRAQTDLSSLLAPGVLDTLLADFRRIVRTDIPPELFPRMIQLLTEVDVNRRDSLVLTPPTFGRECYPCPPSGQYVLQANVPAIRRGVQQILDVDPAAEQQRAKYASEQAVVHVLRGTPDVNQATRVADYFASLGIDAIVPPLNGGQAETLDHVETTITVYNGREAEAPETIRTLAEALGVTATTATDPAATADIVVITGTSTPDLEPPE